MISGIGAITNAASSVTGQASQSPSTYPSFGEFLQNAMDSTNQVLNQADTNASVYAAGGPVSVDQLMISEQQASLALDTVVQVRDRVVSAYQSIMNMQV